MVDRVVQGNKQKFHRILFLEIGSIMIIKYVK